MARDGHSVELQAELEFNFVKETDSHVLLNSGLLQFPYGIGGMNETRLLHDGSFTTRSDPKDYLEQLSLRAQPCFQSSLSQLIMYSLLLKFQLLKASRLQMKGKTDAYNLAEGLTATADG